MTDVTSISVLIVNYDAYGELRECLSSLLDQEGVREIIVSDHASVAARREALARQHPHVHWIATSGNPGFAAGVNRAARAASGAYLYVLNPDAVVARGTPRQLVNCFLTHANVGAAGSAVWDSDGTLQHSARRFPNFTTALAGRSTFLTRWLPGNPLTRRNLVARPEMNEPVDVDWVSGASMMVRRTAFDAVGGFDERYFLYWEDADFCKRLRHSGWRTMYDPSGSVVHAGGRSSRSSARSIIAFHESAYRYYRQHGGTLSKVARPAVYGALKLRMLVKLWAARGRPGEIS